MTIFNRMNKKVPRVVAALAATLVVGAATFVVIQYSTARTSASPDAAARARIANRVQDLHAFEEAAEPTTTTTMPVATTLPVPAIVTFPPVKAPPIAAAARTVPPDGALATCDVPAQVQAGTTSSFLCRIQMGSQFQGHPSLILMCTTYAPCQMNPMIIEGIVPGGTYTSTATFTIAAQTAPRESMSLQITAANSI